MIRVLVIINFSNFANQVSVTVIYFS